MKKNLFNEYDLLDSVIVHSPNIEHNAMTPTNLNPLDSDNYLSFDDVIFTEKARTEHFGFTQTISQVANCFELTDLLGEVLSDESIKNNFILDLAKVYNQSTIIPIEDDQTKWSLGTVAMKKQLDKKLISENFQLKTLSTRELEHLATRSSVPYRDPTGRGNSKEIILSREIEQSKSQLINTSSWRKRWNTAQLP